MSEEFYQLNYKQKPPTGIEPVLPTRKVRVLPLDEGGVFIKKNGYIRNRT